MLGQLCSMVQLLISLNLRELVVTTDCVITGEGISLGTHVDVPKQVAVVWVGSEADSSSTDLVGWVVDAG